MDTAYLDRRYRRAILAFVISKIPPSFEEFRDAEDALSALSIPEDPFEGGRKYLYIPNFVTCKASLLRSFAQVIELSRCTGGYGNFMQDRVLLAQLSYVANRRSAFDVFLLFDAGINMSLQLRFR